MFKVIIVGGPAENYINKCLDSLKSQKEEYGAQVVLDPVGDLTGEQALRHSSDRIKIHINGERKWALPNIIKAISLLNPKDDDILVTLDADDWFSRPDALSIVKSFYDQNPNLLVTHGSWVGYPNANCDTNCVAYSAEEFRSNIRMFPWKGTHLRTLKYKVWKHIKNEDLRYSDGEYFKCAWDLAFMWPALEMAGYDRVRFISERIYVYNRETPHNDEKLRSPQQQSFHHYLQAKPPYSCLP